MKKLAVHDRHERFWCKFFWSTLGDTSNKAAICHTEQPKLCVYYVHVHIYSSILHRSKPAENDRISQSFQSSRRFANCSENTPLFLYGLSCTQLQIKRAKQITNEQWLAGTDAEVQRRKQLLMSGTVTFFFIRMRRVFSTFQTKNVLC